MLSALQIRTDAGKDHTGLSSITTGIKTGPCPVRFMTAIDTAQAHMGNRTLMHCVSQQYRQQVHDIARDGLRGSPRPFPFKELIQQSFGEHHDISGLEAYTGAAARAANANLDSRAYHKGGQVAFAGQPTLREAAHEAAHFVQNARDDELEGGIGESNDRYERHADAVADRVVREQSAAPLLEQVPGDSTGSAPGANSISAPVQMTGGNLPGRLVRPGRGFGNRGIQAPQRRYFQQLLAGNRALIASAQSPDPYQAEIFKRKTELRRLFKKYNAAMGMPLFPFPDSVEDSIQRSYQLGDSGGWDNAGVGKVLDELFILQEKRRKLDLDAFGSIGKFEEHIKATHPGAWSFNDLLHNDGAKKAGFPVEMIRYAACPLAKVAQYPVWPKIYAHCVDKMAEALETNPSAEGAHVNFDSLRTERIAELIKIGNAGQFDDMTQWEMSARLGVTEWELIRALETLGSSRVHTYSHNSREAKYVEFSLPIPDKLPEVGTPEHERLVEYFRTLAIRYAGPG